MGPSPVTGVPLRKQKNRYKVEKAMWAQVQSRTSMGWLEETICVKGWFIDWVPKYLEPVWGAPLCQRQICRQPQASEGRPGTGWVWAISVLWIFCLSWSAFPHLACRLKRVSPIVWRTKRMALGLTCCPSHLPLRHCLHFLTTHPLGLDFSPQFLN